MWYLTLEKETPIPEENKNSDDDACGSLKNSRTLPIRIWLAFLLDAWEQGFIINFGFGCSLKSEDIINRRIDSALASVLLGKTQ